MADKIVIDSSEKLEGKTFRIAQMRGPACQRSLWCRVDWKDDDFRLTFYDHHRSAAHDWKPLNSLSGELLPLAAKAIEHAMEILEAWKNSE